ncbi:MAG: hypothetical protein HOV81_03315 [Kofleriaceae bacterium]|nr:hypothetical protein [Kofleriaceae bacterium]
MAMREAVRDIGARARRWFAALTPFKRMFAGWLVFMLYAFPGYMSYDSVLQLREARWGYYSDGHPPMMAELWRTTDYFVAGPLGMLVVQSVCFLAGVYLIFKRRMSPRTAAVAAVLVLLFPPVSSVMAVIWKDSQMTAFMLLGLGLMLQDSRRARVLGLVAMAAGTAMRHNALVMTLPLVVLLFVWDERYGAVKRYGIALVAWIVLTMSARVVNNALTFSHRSVWVDKIAPCDIVATLRHTSPQIPDDEMRTLLEGTRLLQSHDLHAFTQRGDEDADLGGTLWDTPYFFLAAPMTDEERDGMVRAWKRVVFSHPRAFLTYRWRIFQRIIGLGGPGDSTVYNWFTDIQDPYKSAFQVDHDAAASRIQNLLRQAMHWCGSSVVFSITVYLALSLLLLPFCVRDRESFALLVSALMGEAILFLIAPTTDWRYSYWLIVAVVIVTVLLVARRRQMVWATASTMKQ